MPSKDRTQKKEVLESLAETARAAIQKDLPTIMEEVKQMGPGDVKTFSIPLKITCKPGGITEITTQVKWNDPHKGPVAKGEINFTPTLPGLEREERKDEAKKPTTKKKTASKKKSAPKRSRSFAAGVPEKDPF